LRGGRVFFFLKKKEAKKTFVSAARRVLYLPAGSELREAREKVFLLLFLPRIQLRNA
jgi:hypothetical protein